MSRIQRVVEATEGPTVLDLGAAQHDADNADNDDWLHKHLCEHFERVVGVDYLAEAVAELNKRGYEFVQADVTDMSLGVEADTVVAGELIEHVDNPGLMLECIADHLKPGRKLVLTTPNPWGLPILRRLLSGRLRINDEHVAWYGPVVLRQLLRRCDFETVEVRPLNYVTPKARLLKWLSLQIFGASTWVVVAEKA